VTVDLIFKAALLYAAGIIVNNKLKYTAWTKKHYASPNTRLSESTTFAEGLEISRQRLLLTEKTNISEKLSFFTEKINSQVILRSTNEVKLLVIVEKSENPHQARSLGADWREQSLCGKEHGWEATKYQLATLKP